MFRERTAIVLALLLLAVAGASPGHATPKSPGGARSWLLEDFHSELAVSEDGGLQVTETLRPRFQGTFNGIVRSIPVDYVTQDGYRFELHLRLESVTDERGDPLRYENSRQGHNEVFKIWVPGAADAAKTVVLHYAIDNAIRYFADHDELYWNVTGTEWPVAIEHSSATVKLPPAAAGPELNTYTYTGPFGSRASEADARIDGNVVSVAAQHPFRPREGLTVSVSWKKGVVKPPSVFTRGWQLLAANWLTFLPLLLPIGLLTALLGRWYLIKRAIDPHQSVVVRYSPPGGLTPGESGTLIDDSADLRDITATLVDLAVRGFLQIRQVEIPKLPAGEKRDYIYRLLKPHEEWDGLTLHETLLLQCIFGYQAEANKEVGLSTLRESFYPNLGRITAALERAVKKHGYYRSLHPSPVLPVVGGVTAFISVLLLFDAIFLYAQLPLSEPAAFSGLLSGLVLLFSNRLVPLRTRLGEQVRNDIRGFAEFLERAHKDYMERIEKDPSMFDKYLPYAMALGVQQHWAKAFADIYQRPPQWYQGTYDGGFSAPQFVSSLNLMSDHAASVFQSPGTSASSGGSSGDESSGSGSSASSGSSGGGHSGGGFGGGGGDAF